MATTNSPGGGPKKPIPRDPQTGPHVLGGGPGKHGSKPGSNKGKDKGPKRYGAHDGFKGVPVRQANQIINHQIRQLLDGIRDERRDVRQEYNQGRNQVNNRYDRALGDINHIFDETGSYINHLNGETAKQFETNRTQAQAAMAALGAALQGNQQSGNAAVSSELGRLGINDPAFTAQLNSDSGFAQQQAGIAGANNMANIDLMASGAASVGNLLAGMSEGSRGSALGGALNDRNDMLDELLGNRNAAMGDIRDAMRDARGSRGDLVNQLLMQMQESQWGQFMDTQGLNLQRRQLRLQERAQNFAQRQANKASSGGSSGGSYSGGGSSGGSSSSGNGGGNDYYSSSNQLLIDALGGTGKKPHKGKRKK